MRPARKDAKRGTRKTVSYGYVGRWSDGSLGWMMPRHATGDRRWANGPNDDVPPGKPTILCRITIEAVTDSRGRDITKIVKGER